MKSLKAKVIVQLPSGKTYEVGTLDIESPDPAEVLNGFKVLGEVLGTPVFGQGFVRSGE